MPTVSFNLKTLPGLGAPPALPQSIVPDGPPFDDHLQRAVRQPEPSTHRPSEPVSAPPPEAEDELSDSPVDTAPHEQPPKTPQKDQEFGTAAVTGPVDEETPADEYEPSGSAEEQNAEGLVGAPALAEVQVIGQEHKWTADRPAAVQLSRSPLEPNFQPEAITGDGRKFDKSTAIPEPITADSLGEAVANVGQQTGDAVEMQLAQQLTAQKQPKPTNSRATAISRKQTSLPSDTSESANTGQPNQINQSASDKVIAELPDQPAPRRPTRDAKIAASDAHHKLNGDQKVAANQPAAISAKIAEKAAKDETATPSFAPETIPDTKSTEVVAKFATNGSVDSTVNSAVRVSGSARPAGKLSGATTTAEVDRVRFVQRVARAFHAAEEQGGSIRLRLSPPELGSLKIEVVLRGGVLTAQLETETSAARSILLDNLPQLRERLAEQNVKIERFDVDVRDQSSGQGGDGSPDAPQRDRHHAQTLRDQARQAKSAATVDSNTIARPGRIAGQAQLDITI